MPYKKSRFNFTYKQDEDAHVVFNTYSKALVVLSDSEFQQFQEMSFDNPEMVQELVDNRILIEESFDEVGFLSYCHNMTKFSKGSLHLVLATTMDCNFACPYCYENRRKGKMSIEVQDAIIRFIQENINHGVQKLDVNSIFEIAVPEITEIKKRLQIGFEFCYDAISYPKSYDLMRASNRNYTYFSEERYSFL